jgi:peptide deformylase
MAIRTIREIGDTVLEKRCKEIAEVTPRIKTLIADMLDTMYDARGVGLAAPQVGVLKQITVIDIGEGPVILINPEMVKMRGDQSGYEGCLSLPGKLGTVVRPAYVKVEALDENMQPIVVEGEGLMARALCHELDHLQGVNFVSLVEGELYDTEEIEAALTEDEEE